MPTVTIKETSTIRVHRPCPLLLLHTVLFLHTNRRPLPDVQPFVSPPSFFPLSESFRSPTLSSFPSERATSYAGIDRCTTKPPADQEEAEQHPTQRLSNACGLKRQARNAEACKGAPRVLKDPQEEKEDERPGTNMGGKAFDEDFLVWTLVFC